MPDWRRPEPPEPRVGPSATLAANARVRARIARGLPTVHLAFGEAGLPVHPLLAERLAASAGLNSYPPVAGTPALLEAVAGYFGRRGLPTDPAAVVTAPGSKPLLYALMLALPGDLVLPQPSWVTYEAQARLAGKAVTRVPIPPEAGGVPAPDLLEDAIAGARARGEDPRLLLLTLPDNPTGTLAPPDLLRAVCDIARSEGLTVISDEIYRDLAYDPAACVSPAELDPERTVITAGLSKNLSIGGWRLGFARFPADDRGLALAAEVTNVASEIWSGTAAPVQAAAAAALAEPPEIVDFMVRGRRLHQRVATALHAAITTAGASCRPPQAAFYLYPEVSAPRFASDDALAEALLEEHGVAVLPGSAFGDRPGALRLRLSSSLLYGTDDEQRWAALNAQDPVELPWIATALARVREAFAGL